jgi:hypothetical protein
VTSPRTRIAALGGVAVLSIIVVAGVLLRAGGAAPGPSPTTGSSLLPSPAPTPTGSPTAAAATEVPATTQSERPVSLGGERTAIVYRIVGDDPLDLEYGYREIERIEFFAVAHGGGLIPIGTIQGSSALGSASLNEAIVSRHLRVSTQGGLSLTFAQHIGEATQERGVAIFDLMRPKARPVVLEAPDEQLFPAWGPDGRLVVGMPGVGIVVFDPRTGVQFTVNTQPQVWDPSGGANRFPWTADASGFVAIRSSDPPDRPVRAPYEIGVLDLAGTFEPTKRLPSLFQPTGYERFLGANGEQLIGYRAVGPDGSERLFSRTDLTSIDLRNYNQTWNASGTGIWELHAADPMQRSWELVSIPRPDRSLVVTTFRVTDFPRIVGLSPDDGEIVLLTRTDGLIRIDTQARRARIVPGSKGISGFAGWASVRVAYPVI